MSTTSEQPPKHPGMNQRETQQLQALQMPESSHRVVTGQYESHKPHGQLVQVIIKDVTLSSVTTTIKLFNGKPVNTSPNPRLIAAKVLRDHQDLLPGLPKEQASFTLKVTREAWAVMHTELSAASNNLSGGIIVVGKLAEVRTGGPTCYLREAWCVPLSKFGEQGLKANARQAARTLSYARISVPSGPVTIQSATVRTLPRRPVAAAPAPGAGQISRSSRRAAANLSQPLNASRVVRRSAQR